MRIRVALRREKPRGGAPGRHRQPASAPASVLSPSCWQEGYFQVSRKYLLEEGYVLTGVCFFFFFYQGGNVSQKALRPRKTGPHARPRPRGKLEGEQGPRASRCSPGSCLSVCPPHPAARRVF